ncbi:Galactose-1-phosphate uridylyltransferase [mine drainage metagenome]|uniref:Galactose-1-phosphate uridylyltransferase n=1 Tax=mine drainage metagenome TaxID=410659 RepID=T1B5I8_9ZZZZ
MQACALRGDGMVREMSNYGRSYVIIDTPEHSHTFEDFNHTEIKDLADSLSSLENSMYEDSKIKFVWINKDYGPMSSGTLSHSHWQGFGYPIMPFEIANRARIAKKFMRSKGECLMEHALSIEGPRVPFRSKNIVAFAPFASLYTGESIVLPNEHAPRFGMLGEETRYELLDACARIVRANNSIFGEHSYNILFYGLKDDKAFHTYAEIIPRLGHLGPMQFAGVYGSNLIPEDYAEMIRRADSDRLSKEQGTSSRYE